MMAITDLIALVIVGSTIKGVAKIVVGGKKDKKGDSK